MIAKLFRKVFRRQVHKPKDKVIFAALSILMTLTMLQLGLVGYLIAGQNQPQSVITVPAAPFIAADDQVLGATTSRIEEPPSPAILNEAPVVTDITDEIEKVPQRVEPKAPITVKPSLPAIDTPFHDVPLEHANYQAIQFLKTKGVIYNDPNLLFLPESDVTRVGAITMLMRAAKIPEESFETSAFTDITSADWFFNAINTAHRLRLIDTFEDGTFRAYEGMTQSELLKIAVNALNLDLSLYPDLPENPDEKYFIFALDNDIFSERLGEKALTKAETAQIIFNLVTRFELL